jgi:hypothetical protein
MVRPTNVRTWRPSAQGWQTFHTDVFVRDGWVLYVRSFAGPVIGYQKLQATVGECPCLRLNHGAASQSTLKYTLKGQATTLPWTHSFLVSNLIRDLYPDTMRTRSGSALRCVWGVALLQLFITIGTSAQCSSLVTYRQHAVLLQSAPKCLRDGCSQGQNNTISSLCPSFSPCSAYWNIFVDQFDEKNSWCTSCKSDVACRIPGWPVMNATALCETTANQLFFSDKGCCTGTDKPFQLATWTRTLCNSS